MAQITMNTYATDGKCHNANYGTYGHECGKPAVWHADKPSTLLCEIPFTSSFCDSCKREGDEAPQFSNWRRVV